MMQTSGGEINGAAEGTGITRTLSWENDSIY